MFNDKLMKLKEEKLIVKRKNKYSLNLSKIEKIIWKKMHQDVTEFEHQIEKILSSNDPIEGCKKLKKGHYQEYTKLRWQLICYKSVYDTKEIRQIEKCILRYEETIEKIAKKLFQLNHLEAQFFLQFPDLIFPS